jgi:hypothetical protein
MATAKRKTTAKKAVKYAAKTQSNAAHAASKNTKSAVNAGAAWATKGADQWQKGASDWMSNSSKMFSQNDAAATMKSATDNMVKMGNDMMGQLFGQGQKGAASNPFAAMQSMFPQAGAMPSMPSFKMPAMPNIPGMDAAKAQEKLASFAKDSAEQISKTAGNANRALNEAMSLGRENTEAAVEVSNVAISVSKELGAELVGYLNKLFAQNVELSKQVLSCRTLNDMFDLSSRMVKTNLDGFFTESVKMSELLFQSANDVSEPINERISDTTERLTKAMAA